MAGYRGFFPSSKTSCVAAEALITVLYDGEPLVEVDVKGSIVIGRLAASRARIDASRIDVKSSIGPMIEQLQQQVVAGSVNPYRDAVRGGSKKIWDGMPRHARGGMRQKDVGAVLEAVHKVATGSVQ